MLRPHLESTNEILSSIGMHFKIVAFHAKSRDKNSRRITQN
jgi:hypothetical protein